MTKTQHYKGHRWTQAEVIRFIAGWNAGDSQEELAAYLSVSVAAVAKFATRLRSEGIPLKRRIRGHVAGRQNTPWTQSEVDYLLRRRNEKATSEQIGIELGRTFYAVQAMINTMRREGVSIPMRGCGVRRLWNPESLNVVGAQLQDSHAVQFEAEANR